MGQPDSSTPFLLEFLSTSYLIDLHWLPVMARREFKICLLAFKAKFGELRYLADLLNLSNVHVGMDFENF